MVALFLLGLGSKLAEDSMLSDAERCRSAFQQAGMGPAQYKLVPDSTVLDVCGSIPNSRRKINSAWHRQKDSERPNNTAERLEQLFDCSAKFESQGKSEKYIYEATKREIIRTCEVIPVYLE